MRRAILCWMVPVFLCMADDSNGRAHIGNCRWVCGMASIFLRQDLM